MKIKNVLTLLPAIAVLVFEPADAQTLSNFTAIQIPSSGDSEGIASPYPATISVSGLTGTITSLTVSLFNFSHTFPTDVDLLLLGPAGQSVILMSDAGGGNPGVAGVNLTFMDGATALPSETGFGSGTYAPTNFALGGPDVFPSPAPAGPYGSTLSVFSGTDPNGTWSLFAVDDTFIDTGSIAGGFSLNFTTSTPPPGTGTGVPDSGSTLLFIGLSLGTMVAVRRRISCR